MSKSKAPVDKEKRNEIFEMIGHLCVGLSILMKGLDKIEHPGKELIAVILILLGLLVIVFSLLRKRFESILNHIKLYIFGAEGVVMALVGYSYMQEGTHTIHYAYFLTSILFFAAIYFYPKIKASNEKKQSVVTPVVTQADGKTNSIASEEKNI